MRDLQWISVLLIFKTQILAAHKMCFGTLDTVYFLDECHICNETWWSGYNTVNKYIPLDKKGTGFYRCNETLYYVIAVGKNLTLHFDPQDLEYAFVGINVTLDASVEFTTWTNQIFLDYTFNNSENSFEVKRREIFHDMTYNKNVQSAMVFDNISQVTFYCFLEISATVAHTTIGVTQTKEISLRVYRLPSDVKPSKLRVRKDEYIKCQATSDPPVFQYMWRCKVKLSNTYYGWETSNTTDWEFSNDTIRFLNHGSFNCSCIAEIKIKEKNYRSTWTGTLTCGLKCNVMECNAKLLVSIFIIIIVVLY